MRLSRNISFLSRFCDVAAPPVWKLVDDFLRRALLAATGVFRPIVLEKLSGNNFREVSDLQVASDRSLATVLASLGWQDFYLKVNVPEFFNTIGR